jgi:hypothetical protein
MQKDVTPLMRVMHVRTGNRPRIGLLSLPDLSRTDRAVWWAIDMTVCQQGGDSQAVACRAAVDLKCMLATLKAFCA